MKKSIVILMSVMFSYTVLANDLVPVAVQSSTPNQTWFYNLEDVVFDADDSYVPNGYIVNTKWYINGVYQTGGSYYRSMSECFALDGSPANGCYQLASGQTTVDIKLEVQSNSGYWHTETVTYTIQEHKGRKYFIKDHLGNVRTTVNRDGNVLGYDDYYPFGLVMPGRSSNSANPNDNYKFTGHERDDEAGLTLDYMGARYYDPIVPHFTSIDPLADQFPGISPYAYAMNNPLKYTDPTGMAPEECCFETLIPLVATAFAKNKDKSVSINYNMELSGGFQLAAESRTAGFGGGFTLDFGSIKLAEVSGTATISMDGIEFSETNNDLKTKGDDVEISQEISGSAPFISMGAAHDFSLRKTGGNTYVSNQEVSVSRTVGVENSTDNTNLKTGDRSLTNTIEASRNTAFVFGFKRSLSIKTSEKKPIEEND